MYYLLTNKILKQRSILLLGILFFFSLFISFAPHKTEAAMLSPGNITTCGELGISGEYILQNELTTSGSSTCFYVSSDNVTINGNGHSITGASTSGSIAIDARARAGGPETGLSEALNGYTNLIIANLTITGFTAGVDTSGNGNTTGSSVRNGNGGDGGELAIYYSILGSVTTKGGDSSTTPAGGVGGNVYMTAVDLDIANSTFNLSGGVGTTARNTDGGLDLNYTGTITKTNVLFSSLAFLNDNTTEYTNYPGGTWPITNTSLSSCGTLYATATTTFTLNQNITNASGTCFTIASNNITLDEAGYTINVENASTTAFLIDISKYTYSNFTLASTTVTNYTNLINSSSSVTISGNNLDISGRYIGAGSLNIIFTGDFVYNLTALSSLTNLILNGSSYGVFDEGLLSNAVGSLVQNTNVGAYSWTSVASDASGNKLAAVISGYSFGTFGYIYTSTDSGNTWVQKKSDSTRNWESITSSADGTKLAAVASLDYIYTSIDSGNTWIQKTVGATRYWESITSDASGAKIAAVVYYGYIYISTDYGNTWLEKATDEVRPWASITSSVDGTKLAAAASTGYIYTSIDSGNTWVQKNTSGSRSWRSITSSADGTKLAAVDSGGYIYTSTDSGNTWTQRMSDATRNWRSITSDASGTKLAAVVQYGYVYTSTDSGNTWVQNTSSDMRSWQSITSSADGTKLAAVVDSGYIYTSTSFLPQLSISILTPTASSTIIQWSPYISWGAAISCEYTWNNGLTWASSTCANNGSDISRPPSIGENTLYIRGTDINNTKVTASSTFQYNLGVFILAPSGTINSWLPSVNWNVNNVATSTLACYYSFDNFVSTSTADCGNGGTDIVMASTTEGNYTLYTKVIDQDNNVGVSSVAFSISSAMVQKTTDATRDWNSIASSAGGAKLAAVFGSGRGGFPDSRYIYTSTDFGVNWTTNNNSSGARYWYSITSSADGTKLAAVVYGGHIYTSTNSGNTWVQKTSDATRDWQSIISSVDGIKLAAVVSSGYIYTSIDSGNTWVQKTSDATRNWRSITSSADGNKLAAVVGGTSGADRYIYTSIDSGNTWVQKTFDATRNWTSITSSADGTKLAAVVRYGYIYTSIDSGNTWVQKTTDATLLWTSITSSADGIKLAAVVDGGYIYTSIDSGNTWVQRTTDVAQIWAYITSSADGTKLAAVIGGSSGDGYIYTSTDSGNTWVQKTFGTRRSWSSITSSADGTKLAAVVRYGYIYTSTDSGNTWVQKTSDATREWNSITSSADGTKLAAVVLGGHTYTSTDSGNTWVQKTSDATRNWYSITSSADGIKLVAVVLGGHTYTSTSFNSQLSINILTPSASSTIIQWSPYISWGTAISCEYSYDNGLTWASSTCANNGSDIPKPTSFGTSTLYVRGADINNTTVTANSIFTYNLGVLIISPAGAINSWLPSINWNVNNVATSTLACYYSFDNFVSTSTANCTSGGMDILSPFGEGNYTLYVKIVDEGGNIGLSSTSFLISSALVQRTTYVTTYWTSITSSADGVKLAAVSSGHIYTSNDSGNTWVQKTFDVSRFWRSITSSADGTKLAAVASNDYIYTSIDSGNTWVQRTFDVARDWWSITSSTNGTKLAAVVWGGYIYTSTDSGNTWVQRTSAGSHYRSSITSSADGTKLAAVVKYGYIYTSTDSGNTWVQKTSDATRNWTSITSSADGTKLAAVIEDGHIYTSIDSGNTWIQKTTGLTYRWASITSSADGAKLAAAVQYNGYIYSSIDFGNTWVQKTTDSTRNWISVASSADGNKLAAAVQEGNIYTSSVFNPQLSVNILTPVSSTTITSFSPFASFGTAISCAYSWNDIDWNTINCANNGVDISRPASSGTSTLYVKGTDINNTTVTASSTFSYSYYVWCGNIDTNWSTVGNWYTNDTCSIPTGAVPNSTIDAYVVGTMSPIINTNTWTAPGNINSTGLTGSAGVDGVIFTGTSTNSVYITGNATFQDSTYNTGTIVGNATYTNGLSGTFTLSNNMKWSGSISGSIKGGDGMDIINLIFNDSSLNETTLTGTASFNNSSNNLGTITGSATFNNTSPFTIGTVNGTVTLNGFSQVLSGVNNVTNFVKQLAGGVRDTLYLLSGSTLNISGLTTLFGSDAGNLLTIRATSPNSPANLGINGASNLNNLRIKDITNTGPLIDLTNANVYDDGGNSGFTFKPNSTPSQRSGGVALTYAPPSYVPKYVPPAPPSGNNNFNNNANRGGSGSSLFNINSNLGKLSLSNLPKFSFGGLGAGSSLGTSKFVNPLTDLLQLQPIAGFDPLPKVYSKLQSNISNFFNSSLPQSLANLSNTVPSIKKELTSAGIINGYDLYSMKDSPVNTPTLSDLAKDKTKQPTNLIFTSVDDKETPTKLSIDKKGRTYQILTVEPNDTIDISIKNTNKTLPITIFDNNPIKPNKDKNNNITLSLNAPKEQGTRVLTVGDLTLEIRVKAQVPATAPKVEKKLTPIVKMWRFFGGR